MLQNLLCGASAMTLLALMGAPAMAQESALGAPASAPAEAVDATIEEVVVTGTRLQTTGFTSPTPVTVVGQDQMQARGAESVLDVLQEMPSFRGMFGTGGTTGGVYAVGQGLLDLRSLGPTRTLVLVNGRRHVPTNADGTFDTNVLPTALIERVDVVTGGASAAYGSDAIAGVVNFVLNDKLEGVRGGLQYGESQRSDAGNWVGKLAAGASFAGGRGHVVVGGDYSHGEPAGTMYSRDWGRRETALIPLPPTRAAGLPALYLTDQQRWIVPPGSLVTSCVRGATPLLGAACPIGNLTFNEAGQPVPYAFGAPRSAIQMAGGGNEGYNQYRNQLLQVGTDRAAGLGQVTYDITDSVTGWAELSGGRFKVESRSADYTNFGSIVIQRDNPFLPTALAAQMDANGVSRFNLARLNYAQQGGLDVRNVNEFWEAAAGLRGVVLDDWRWTASYSNGRSTFWYRPRGLTVLPNYMAALYVVRDGAGNPVCGLVATNPMFAALPPAQRAAFASVVSAGCQPFNPFGPNAESRAALDYVAPQNIESQTIYEQQSAEASIAGSPFSTPAGDVSVAVGLEWRRASSEVKLDPTTNALVAAGAFFAGSPPLPSSGSVEVREGFAEIGAPILRDLTLVQALDLNAAVRVTDYSSSGTVTTWKLGGVWDVNDSLRIRATRSRDIRAPGISELYYRGNNLFLQATNPVTGVATQVGSSLQNNANLQPERADTWTVGAVFQPRWDWARGFRASVDYYSITVKDVISALSIDKIVNGYYLGTRPEYARFITFDAAAPAGFSRVDPQFENLNKQIVEGLDINLEYAVPLETLGAPGDLKLTAVGSHLARLETFDAGGATLDDIAGAIPKWGWTGSVNYRLDRFSTTLTARYNSSQTFNVLFQGPEDEGYNPASPTSVSRNRFPEMVYWSLQSEYSVIEGEGRQLVVYGIIDNLFDEDPPAGSFTMLSGVGSPASKLYNAYDNIGRYFKAGVRFSF